MKQNIYLPALTGVRAIAAFMVFFHHFNQANFPLPIFKILNEFHTGVTVFFVLSGFLICLRYYDTVSLDATWFKRYIKNRVARIYPMYLLLTIATFVVAFYASDNSVFNNYNFKTTIVLLNIFFVRGFFDELKFTGVSQGWSLTVEECFYFLAPVFFIKIKQHKRNWFLLPLMVLGVGVILVLLCKKFNWYGFYGNFTFMFLYTFTGRCVEFFIGMFVATLVLKHSHKTFNKPTYTLIGLLISIASIGIMASIPLTATLKHGLHHPIGMVANNVLLPIGIAIFFYGIINENSIVQRFLSNKTMDILGKSSYIFYLIHIGIIAQFFSKLYEHKIEQIINWADENDYQFISNHLSGNWSGLLLITMVFITLNIVSIILYKTIEEPLNVRIRRSNFLVKSK